MQREMWEHVGTFTVELERPTGIAINLDGDIAVTSKHKGVRVLSKTGQVKCSFMKNCQLLRDTVVSHDNRYVVANGHNFKGIQFHTKNGNYLSNVPVSDTTGKKSNLISVAVDASDRIIAGHDRNAISIHYADGSLISKCATTSMPFCLAATSEGEIVCSCSDRQCLELMDYSGSNVRTVQPPPEVRSWAPTFVCCRQGEIFVVNIGNHRGVFRYTAKGNYLGCVTTEVQNPAGIALSQDGMELFVVEHNDQQIKIFHRE